MTEDDAQAWLQHHKIRFPVKPSTVVDKPGWRFRLIRSSKDYLDIIVPEKSAVSLLEFISREAWEKYPTKNVAPFGVKLWSFFSLDELRELHSEFLETTG